MAKQPDAEVRIFVLRTDVARQLMPERKSYICCTE